LDDVTPGDMTIATVPERFARLGDLHAEIDDVAHRLDTLLEWADRDDIGVGTDEPDVIDMDR
ncbi:MAG: ATP-dependent DNA ligase, partial [Mycobacterium sp.]|nr:ATP-dependent DNA ligase [Mycobacterium sp.]